MSSSLNLNSLSLQHRANRSHRKLGGAAFVQSAQDSIKCTICTNRFAKYTCPACNLRYCRVECFKSQKHSVCSESFYRNALIEDVNKNPALEGEMQKKMLEMLKRLDHEEEDSSGDEEDETNSLTSEDLSKLTEAELLKLLSPAQVQEFERKLQTGELGAGFVEATINSQCDDPWWIDSDSSSSSEVRRRPSLVPQSLLPQLPDEPKPDLIYHVFSLALGYVFLLRHFGLRSLHEVSEDRQEILNRLQDFFPVLVNDSIRPTSVSECFGIFLSGVSQATPEMIPLLLKDLRVLFPEARTKKVMLVGDDGASVPECALALSDLYEFLDKDWCQARSNKVKKTALMKVRYMVAFAMDSGRVGALAKEIRERSPPLEAGLDQLDEPQFDPSGDLIGHRPDEWLVDNGQPKIVEI